MIRFLMIGLLIYIGYRIIISLTSARRTEVRHAENKKSDEEIFRDPVCGIYISAEDAVIGKLDGQRHYFCSMDCLEKYREQLDHSSKL